MKCPRCQMTNPMTAASCCKCALRFEGVASAPRVVYSEDTYTQTDHVKTGLAWASLVIGVIGIFTLGIAVIGAITGCILAAIAISKCSNQPDSYGGKNIAIAGLVSNIVAILTVPVVGIVAAIVIVCAY